MSKRIYFFINDEDLFDLLSFLTEGGFTYRCDTQFKAINPNLVKVEITYQRNKENNQNYIHFYPSISSETYTSDAYIVLDDEAEAHQNLTKAFRKIKKYIKSHYTLSKNKAYYIGPNIYKDWLKREVKLPVLLEYEEIVIGENSINLKRFFDCIVNQGYYVKVNFAKLRNIDVLDLTANSFIVYSSLDKIEKTIINRNMVRYDFDSECIFIYKTKHGKETVLSFLLDKRVLKKSSSKLVLLFEKLRDKTTNI
ncbi:MAG: hypothetical protein IJC50_05915 [Clostridia bacterium]|nr:hypothetical protein [Clostridia bacterium]